MLCRSLDEKRDEKRSRHRRDTRPAADARPHTGSSDASSRASARSGGTSHRSGSVRSLTGRPAKASPRRAGDLGDISEAPDGVDVSPADAEIGAILAEPAGPREPFAEDLGAEARPRYRRDIAEISPRYRRDIAEILPRYRRDIAEISPRYRRGAHRASMCGTRASV